jgi:hypothetical protein
MRITEAQLKRIIREEARRALQEGAPDAEELLDLARRMANIDGFFESTWFDVDDPQDPSVDAAALGYVTRAAHQIGIDPHQHPAEVSSAAAALRDEHTESARIASDSTLASDKETLLMQAWSSGLFDARRRDRDAIAEDIVDSWIAEWDGERSFHPDYRDALVDHLVAMYDREEERMERLREMGI